MVPPVTSSSGVSSTYRKREIPENEGAESEWASSASLTAGPSSHRNMSDVNQRAVLYAHVPAASRSNTAVRKTAHPRCFRCSVFDTASVLQAVNEPTVVVLVQDVLTHRNPTSDWRLGDVTLQVVRDALAPLPSQIPSTIARLCHVAFASRDSLDTAFERVDGVYRRLAPSLLGRISRITNAVSVDLSPRYQPRVELGVPVRVHVRTICTD